jgi:short-subunit dehydrogenase
LAAKDYRVILASRNQDASRRAIESIRTEQPDAQVETMPLDLASFDSVREFVSAFQGRGYPLHLLINNTGGSISGKEASFTADGF